MEHNPHSAEDIEVVMGSGNVYADLGRPDPEERQFKSLLAMQIRDLIAQDGLAPPDAAPRLGLEPDEVDALWRGRLSDFSVGRLIRCLNRLGRRVDVQVSAQTALSDAEALTLTAA